MKTIAIPKPFTKRTVWFKSHSTPGVKYKTERHKDGTATCFCPGYVYRQTCKHVVEAGTWK